MTDAPSQPLLAVQLCGRGRLPFEQLHGHPLLAHVLHTAARAAGGPVTVLVDKATSAADVRRVVRASGEVAEIVDAGSWWPRQAAPVLLLDVLCPLVPLAFVREVAALAAERPGTALVGYRPVTDTVKSVVGGKVQGTIDRERLAIVTSPVLVPLSVRGGAHSDPPPADAAELVGWLRDRVPVELVRAPSVGRRVEDVASVHLLECVDEIARRTR
jgi:2-C-methyl-D-erythritol 4-phosphate cytidylyltransferase